MKLHVYFRPKYYDQLDLQSPSNEQQLDLDSFHDLNEPVFISRLTSKFLFERVSKHLAANYRSKSYINRYNYQPQCLQTFNASSEGIDFLLTQKDVKLTDFLYSSYNT